MLHRHFHFKVVADHSNQSIAFTTKARKRKQQPTTNGILSAVAGVFHEQNIFKDVYLTTVPSPHLEGPQLLSFENSAKYLSFLEIRGVLLDKSPTGTLEIYPTMLTSYSASKDALRTMKEFRAKHWDTFSAKLRQNLEEDLEVERVEATLGGYVIITPKASSNKEAMGEGRHFHKFYVNLGGWEYDVLVSKHHK